MTNHELDDLARTLATRTSRRTAIKALAGAFAGSLVTYFGGRQVGATPATTPCGECPPCTRCNRQTGQCVERVCGNPCRRCNPETNACEPIDCPPCTRCDPHTGVCEPKACNNPCRTCNPETDACELKECPPCQRCDPATGQCVEKVCGNPCRECDPETGKCRKRECPPCQRCDRESGACVPVCGACQTCDEATGVCRPLECAPCERCDPAAGVCVPIDCPACTTCNPETQLCDPVTCGPCEYCDPTVGAEGGCVSACPACTVCDDAGDCVPVCPPCHECDALGNCIPLCPPCHACGDDGSCVPQCGECEFCNLLGTCQQAPDLASCAPGSDRICCDGICQPAGVTVCVDVCTTNADCADGDACTLNRCVDGVCITTPACGECFACQAFSNAEEDFVCLGVSGPPCTLPSGAEGVCCESVCIDPSVSCCADDDCPPCHRCDAVQRICVSTCRECQVCDPAIGRCVAVPDLTACGPTGSQVCCAGRCRPLGVSVCCTTNADCYDGDSCSVDVCDGGVCRRSPYDCGPCFFCDPFAAPDGESPICLPDDGEDCVCESGLPGTCAAGICVC